MNGSCVTAKIAGIESTAKMQVGRLDERQHDEQRRRDQSPAAAHRLSDEELLTVIDGR